MAGHKDKGFGPTLTGETEGGSAEPILALLRGADDWLLNRDILPALGLTSKRGNHSITGHWRGNIDDIFGTETRMIEPVGYSKQGRLLRAYSKKALVIMALRARTPNAAAFKLWLADRALSLI